MAVNSPNGSRGTTEMEAEWEAESTHYSNPEFESEGEASHFSHPYSSPEAEWEDEIAHHSNPYSNPEMEWEASHYSNPYSNPELEWEQEAAHYFNPYSNPEFEWEQEVTHYSQPETPGAFTVPPGVAASTRQSARRLIAPARRAAPDVVHVVLGSAAGRSPRGRRGWRRRIGILLRQLGRVLSEGESAAAELEAQHFGSNEFEAELAAHEIAHEAALTEVLAAEAAHTESESEAAALLGVALPITIRIMGGHRALRPVMPTLAQANARLVRGLRSSGPAGSQLLRVVPSIQRRTVASLRAAQGAGHPITPTLVARVMAGHAARVLGTSGMSGPAIVRNTTIRRSTVAPAGQIVRPRRQGRY